MNLQSFGGFYTNEKIIPIFNNPNQIYDKTSKFCEQLDLSLEDIVILQKQISVLTQK
jgi:hypothetical protein